MTERVDVVRHRAVHDVVGKAGDDGGGDHGDDGELGALSAAQTGAERVTPANHDVPEHGDRHRQPARHA